VSVIEEYPSRETSLGTLPIWRALPVRGRRLVGPWCFLDRYGPMSFTNAKPMDVAPHPHIGLQTVSWLLEGEVVHHDTLGYEAVVHPGGVNVMTAGAGIAHPEETPPRHVGRLNGVQLWIALPDAHRNVAPSFQPIAEVPRLERGGAVMQVIAGLHEDVRSPANTYSDLVGLDVALRRAEPLELPLAATREHALFLLDGEVALEGQPLAPHTLYYLAPGRTALSVRTATEARFLLLGGTPFQERVLMWWNFVARHPDEIATARTAWQEGHFGVVRGYDGPAIPAPPLSRLADPNPAS
jgi:redox-sensitive bicupin YhaK (pirin superfamily)